MERTKTLEKAHDTLRQIGAAGMRIAANGPTVGEVVGHALTPGATEATVDQAKSLAGMALDQYPAAPKHAELVAATKAALAAIS